MAIDDQQISFDMFHEEKDLPYQNVCFKEVNFVNRGMWVDKDLASQRSLFRKLLKEATRKPLNEAS